MKPIIPGIALFLTAATACHGQTRAQLGKALFAEEVEQDSTKASAIYQQIINESADAPRNQAFARFRLAKIHLTAGRETEALALLQAITTDDKAPAEWVAEARPLVDATRVVDPPVASGKPFDVSKRLLDKLWYWHSGDGEPFGALRFLPDGRIETTLGVNFITGWVPMGGNRFRVTNRSGNHWLMELAEDGRRTTGIAHPDAVDPFKFVALHPNPSLSIDEAEIEFLKKILEEQPDMIAAWKVPCNLAKFNRTRSLAFLFEQGVQVDLRERDSFHYTPLMYAVEYGEPGTVRFLLDHGADVNALDNRKVSPLFIASWHGRSEVVSLLIDRGADLEFSSPHIDDRDRRLDLGTALHGAARQGHMHIVKLLLDRGANINAVSPAMQQTPLTTALTVRNDQLAEELLIRGADPNLPRSGIVNPLRQMAFQGDLAMLRMLLKNGARLDVQSDATREWHGITRTVGAALPAAAREGHLHVAKALVEAGCPVDQTTPVYMETSLHAAALHGNTAMCRWLLERGADRHSRLADKIGIQSGWLPLHSAAWSGSIEVVGLLLKMGASPTEPCFQTGNARTPFHIAVQKGWVPVVRLMIEHESDSSPEAAAWLLSHADAQGNTALHLAVSREAKADRELVRLLIASGASLSAVNRRTETPRQLCLDPEHGSSDAGVRMLLDER
ncbi:MAG: ankyrin repeat domain-containing protein [Verrucomicrobiae bacterium]|nr:ankyrin repeat domain-containing protein [Verrucomicrobiae bacterium]